jgi:two-component system response regulator PilR (NtrC family)
MSRILVVDDELSMREMLEIFLAQDGHEVLTAADGAKGIARLTEEDDLDLVITDLRMPGAHGMVVLERARELHPTTPVVVMTAFASHQTATEAMKMGAYDYFSKPFSLDDIKATVDRALERRRLVVESKRLRDTLHEQGVMRSLIGSSRAMQQVFDLVRRVARTRTNVLVLGESGTGKELIARALHEQSERRAAPFVVINCGAVPENLLESEFFGHKRGAFTGANADKDGLFKAASGGTLFLDEVGELPLSMQVKLLRVLQERRVKPVGDVREFPVDVRLIAATNRNLETEVRAGRFREDLYYRLNVISVELPPLRERPGDIALLAFHFLRRFADELGKNITDIEPDALQLLARHPFPGNVRELENVLERAVALEEGERITVWSLPPHLRPRPQPAAVEGAPLTLPGAGVDLDAVVEELERRLITQALQRTGGLKKEAARLLGISFRSFRYRLQKLHLAADEGPDDGADE